MDPSAPPPPDALPPPVSAPTGVSGHHNRIPGPPQGRPPGPPSHPQVGPKADSDCGCVGELNPFLGFIGEPDEGESMFTVT